MDPELIGVCRVQWQICYFFILLVRLFFLGRLLHFSPNEQQLQLAGFVARSAGAGWLGWLASPLTCTLFT